MCKADRRIAGITQPSAQDLSRLRKIPRAKRSHSGSLPRLSKARRLRILRQNKRQKRFRYDNFSAKRVEDDAEKIELVKPKRKVETNDASRIELKKSKASIDVKDETGTISTIEEDTPKSKSLSCMDQQDATALRQKLLLSIEDDPYNDCPAPIKSFQELKGLPAYVLSSLQRSGITAPMPIQAQALPLVLKGRDVIGLAQTGSGKTLAFLLPAAIHLEKQPSHVLTTPPRVPAPIVLVLAPTRELAVQISDEAAKVFESSKDTSVPWVHTVPVYGGGDKWTQQKNLRRGAHIVTATPGRLSDFVNTNVLSMERVTYFVLDEADRMLDMGFHDDVAGLAKHMKRDRQMLFFSATWSIEVQKLAQGLCRAGSKPVRISCGQAGIRGDEEGSAKQMAREGITQQVIVVDHKGDKRWEQQELEKNKILDKHLQEVLKASEEHKVLVFVSQKVLADKVSTRFQNLGFKADAMHGGKSQEYRLWVLDQFRKGELRVLVCTDVLGRGIDIPSVSHVVIHEMGEIEDYIHRIGRTARGKYGKGHALVFFEYWEGSPNIASDFIGVLEASKQTVPQELRKIASEVSQGKRPVQAPKQGPSWNKW